MKWFRKVKIFACVSHQYLWISSRECQCLGHRCSKTSHLSRSITLVETSMLRCNHQRAIKVRVVHLASPVFVNRLMLEPESMAMTEEEREAIEEEQHKCQLRAYHDEFQNLLWATALLIQCTTFYVVIRALRPRTRDHHVLSKPHSCQLAGHSWCSGF